GGGGGRGGGGEAMGRGGVLGFEVRWRPAPTAGLLFWPSDLPVPPPLNATAFQVEWRLEPAGPFTPVLASEDNTMFGSREEPLPDRTMHPGIDLMQVFPEEAPPRRGGEEFHYQDAFRAPNDVNPSRRLPPPP